MMQSRILRTFLIGVGTAGLLFIAALIIGGGGTDIELKIAGVEKPSSAAPAKVNLTEAAGASILAQLEPEGTPDGSGVTPREIAGDAFQAALASFEPEDLFPLIRTSDFKIAASYTAEDERVYLARLLTSLRDAGGVVPARKDNPSLLDFGAARAKYDKAMQELRSLAVPARLVEIQRDAMSIVGAQRSILAILENHGADPVQAYLAAETEAAVIDRIELLHDDISFHISRMGLSS